jgi:DNA-binding LytR/AlgR family response regulator
MLPYQNEIFKDRIILKNRSKLDVSVGEIILLEGHSNYTTFILDTGAMHSVSYTLKHFSMFLESQGFYRINRGIMINPLHVKMYNSYTNQLTMSNDKIVQISRRRKDNFAINLREKSIKFGKHKKGAKG